MKKIFRSNKNRMIGGVCAGLAEYLDVDPTIIRLLTAALTVIGGLSIFVYLIAWIIIPEDQVA
jgi:phage shock protein PspC (stress-responsive transcriptional regulator)